MNKLILSLAALLLGGLTASAGANVYATGLKYEKAENGDYTFSYTLNVAATAVNILIYDANGNVAKTITSDGLVQGINTFTTQLPLKSEIIAGLSRQLPSQPKVKLRQWLRPKTRLHIRALIWFGVVLEELM